MSDVLQALLDSGVLYLGLGATICIVLGVGAVRRLSLIRIIATFSQLPTDEVVVPWWLHP
jgi:hypothetical protein